MNKKEFAFLISRAFALVFIILFLQQGYTLLSQLLAIVSMPQGRPVSPMLTNSIILGSTYTLLYASAVWYFWSNATGVSNMLNKGNKK